MDRIARKLMKYFISIIALIIAICLIVSSIFLSKFYLKQQYDSLQASAKDIYNSLKSNESINTTSITAILIQDNNIIPLTQGKMGMMPFLRSVNGNNFKTKGIFKNGMNTEFLYYKLQTDIGDIIVFQNNKYSSDYLKIVYIVLFFIFIFSVLLSIPLISYVGKKFTKPILKLEKVASSISKGNFDVDCNVKTNDEIETLSKSLNQMAIDLKKKYQLQRDFVANVSHDFKTPLSVIRSYSEAINDGLVNEENLEKYSKEIISEVDRLNTLVVDLLQLSKLQDGAYSLDKQFFNLSNFIDECVNYFNPITIERNISIISSIEPLEIYADKKYLQRVLYNFIDNAIKFSDEYSKIEIFNSELNNHIKLSVKDYGVGIKSHLLADIWDKYYKNSQSGGMGLGLAICKEILKMHDFEYDVTSSNEFGTEFYFLISKEDIRTLT
ncbi:sensor histidine kinase [Clostridium peptidivorans]|uniref:sensor histidine kinase n=1 Tax=Clostridium peptidivorans TaxID=100174 RepID=UPI000BE31A87|nr:HAMP domain-containing sensor histidine kinase [Clostridium peptidivorans]